MKNIKNLTKRILCVLLALTLMCACNISAFASANSGALSVEDDFDNETTNYRAYLEYLFKGTAGVMRQNVMHTYLKAGETVYFGSSVHNSQIDEAGTKNTGKITGSDIVVTYPDGTLHSYDVIENGAGYIYKRDHELNGPKITIADNDDDKKYTPLSFTATTSGLYDFSFRSRTGATAAPKPALIYNDAAAINGQGTSDIAFWDITVADQDGNKIPGRTYNKYLATSTGATYANMVAQYYVVTNDGYIYRTYFENVQPFGFVFFSNNQGLTTTGLTPSSIYHSVYNNDNDCLNPETENLVTFHHPNAPDTDLAQTNMIFFEEPNKDLIGILFDEPVVPSAIEEVEFFGHKENKTYYTQGGEFKFISHGASSVSLVIDFNPAINHVWHDLQEKLDAGEALTKQEQRVQKSIKEYREANGSGIIEINAATVDGENSVEWDGMDDRNVHMPIGVYNVDDIAITSYPKAGEIHFPFIDMEGSYHGVRIERLNGSGGRDSANPSEDRFGICYNNNPLVYGTIEGPLDPSETNPWKEPEIITVGDVKYYQLSDGTRSYYPYQKKDNDGKYFMGNEFFVEDYKPTTGNYAYMHQPKTDLLYNHGLVGEVVDSEGHKFLEPHISTLVRNTNFINPEDEEYGEGVSVNGSAEYEHIPINSQEYNMTFGTDGGNNGGGNQALIDIGTYYYGKVTTKIKFNGHFEIADNEGMGAISGRIFYDDNRTKYNETYATADGDYLLPDIKVWLTDINGNKLQVMDHNGYPVYTDQSGNEVFKNEDNEFVDSQGNIVSCNESDLTPEYYTTTTDLNGAYEFRGVYYGAGKSKDFFVQTDLTDTQKTAYTICTTRNDFNLAKIANTAPVKQNVTLNDSEPDGQFGDIGYTTSKANLVDLTVSKYWDGEVADRPSSIKVQLYQLAPKETDMSKAKLYSEKLLSATNGWRHTFTDLNKTYKYYVKEWIEKDDHDELIGTSEAKFINATDFDSEITSSVSETNEDSGYFANFTFNPNIVGPTIVITNKEIIHNYRVVFHENPTGYSDINTENDYFKIYCRENAIPTVKEHTGFNNVNALNQDTWDIDAFYDIPERNGYVFTGWYYDASFDQGSKPLKWTTDTYTGKNETDNDGTKYTMTDNNVYHIYAHWVPVGTVTKDANDEKIIDGKGNYYGGFELIGVQIRDYRLDSNYDPYQRDENGDIIYDDNGNPVRQEQYYGYIKEKHGLRFINSIRNGLLAAVNDAYDVDAQEEFYDYENTKTYSKNSAYQNIEYGYVTATKTNWDKFEANYNGKNGYVYDQLKYNGTNVNGEKTSSKYKYVSNVQCTSSVGPNYKDESNFDRGYNTSTTILDHRNYPEYRIASMVMTYNGLTETDKMAADVIARPYLKYVDSNGLVRVFYANYTGESAVGKGCCVKYNDVKNRIQEILETVTNINK